MPDIYKQTNIQDVILTALAVIVILVLGGCLYSFFRAIFFFIFSGGKDDKRKKGWNSIRFMIVGVILMMALLISFPYLLKGMGVTLQEEYTTKAVFTKAGEVFKNLFNIGKIIKEGQKSNEFRGQPYYNLNGSDVPAGATPLNTNYQL